MFIFIYRDCIVQKCLFYSIGNNRYILIASGRWIGKIVSKLLNVSLPALKTTITNQTDPIFTWKCHKYNDNFRMGKDKYEIIYWTLAKMNKKGI